MSKAKYMDFFIKCSHDPDVSYFLCHRFGNPRVGGDNDKLFKLFIPTLKEHQQHMREGYGFVAWGSKNDGDPQPGIHYGFTELRQTVILLMAAMNGEL